MSVIETIEQLEAIYGFPNDASTVKVADHVTHRRMGAHRPVPLGEPTDRVGKRAGDVAGRNPRITGCRIKKGNHVGVLIIVVVGHWSVTCGQLGEPVRRAFGVGEVGVRHDHTIDSDNAVAA